MVQYFDLLKDQKEGKTMFYQPVPVDETTLRRLANEEIIRILESPCFFRKGVDGKMSFPPDVEMELFFLQTDIANWPI